MITDAQMKFMLVGVNANPKMMADTYTDFLTYMFPNGVFSKFFCYGISPHYLLAGFHRLEISIQTFQTHKY